MISAAMSSEVIFSAAIFSAASLSEKEPVPRPSSTWAASFAAEEEGEGEEGEDGATACASVAVGVAVGVAVRGAEEESAACIPSSARTPAASSTPEARTTAASLAEANVTGTPVPCAEARLAPTASEPGIVFTPAPVPTIRGPGSNDSNPRPKARRFSTTFSCTFSCALSWDRS